MVLDTQVRTSSLVSLHFVIIARFIFVVIARFIFVVIARFIFVVIARFIFVVIARFILINLVHEYIKVQQLMKMVEQQSLRVLLKQHS